MDHPPKYLEFVYLPEFERAAKGLFTDNDLREMENALAARPDAGALVAGTGGMRKLRVALEGRGKSGGARVIYYYRNQKGRVYLITAYAKNVAESLSNAGKAALRELATVLDGEG